MWDALNNRDLDKQFSVSKLRELNFTAQETGLLVFKFGFLKLRADAFFGASFSNAATSFLSILSAKASLTFDWGAFLEDCVISENCAPLGAGIACSNDTDLEFFGCTISDNEAEVSGGGGALSSAVHLEECVIRGISR